MDALLLDGEVDSLPNDALPGIIAGILALSTNPQLALLKP